MPRGSLLECYGCLGSGVPLLRPVPRSTRIGKCTPQQNRSGYGVLRREKGGPGGREFGKRAHARRPLPRRRVSGSERVRVEVSILVDTTGDWVGLHACLNTAPALLCVSR